MRFQTFSISSVTLFAALSLGLVLSCGRQKVAPTIDPVVTDLHSFKAIQSTILGPKCQECHRPGKKKGNIDLTTCDAVLKGTKKSVVPGKPEESLLYQVVRDDEMPLNADPLTAKEKKAIADWIQDGAKDN